MNRVVQIVAVALAVAGIHPAEAINAQSALPSVAQIYDKFADAVGGRSAWAGIQGRTEVGTAEITAAGASGEYKRYLAAPNRLRMMLDFGVMKLDQGFDGEKGWISQGMGSQRMPAEQEKSLKETSQAGASFLDPSRFAKAEVTGRETFEGTESYKVAVTTKSGEERTDYFDANSGLLIGTDNTGVAGQVRILYKDYKAFDGKKIATKVVQKTPQTDIVITIASVVFGTPDATVFKAPDDLK